MIAATVAQAARGFAEILDSVEHGETVVITRDGVPVQAEIGQFRAEDRTGRDEVHDRAVD